MTKTLDTNIAFLVQVFSVLTTKEELSLFLRDIFTEAEIAEFSGRLRVAQVLSEGKSQRTVAKETGISIATVTRVNKWLKRGNGTYQLVIDRLKALGQNKADTDKHRNS